MVKPPPFPQTNPHFVCWRKTHHWPITTQDFLNEPQLATSKFVAWQVESEIVIRATTLFNLQCNSVARQVERKCCPYYLTWTEINIKYDMDVHGWSLLHYSHFDTSTCASAKELLPLLSFALAGLLFQFKVQTTDMNFLNLIPYIGIHIKLALTQGIYICRILFYPKDFFHSWI